MNIVQGKCTCESPPPAFAVSCGDDCTRLVCCPGCSAFLYAQLRKGTDMCDEASDRYHDMPARRRA